ncbi:MAG TPA: ATP-binding protein [Bryobacteraceae bacterium]|nr:ATP-binding protein [Bryobacteraceae bacterium]
MRKIEDLEQFAYVAAHDLQEPLRMVAGYSQLLAERYGATLDPAAGEFLAYALEGARRMQDLVDSLLLLACGDPKADTRRPISSAEVVSEALANLRLAIEESHVKVRLGRLPEVLADPAQLMRLFQNLIGNAIRYRSGRLLEISVECEERPRDWLFRVTDNGRGFAHPPAPGLGLEICRRIAERHGGRLWVGSPGGGAVICFTLARS